MKTAVKIAVLCLVLSSCTPSSDTPSNKQKAEDKTDTASSSAMLSDNMASKYFSKEMMQSVSPGALALMSCCAYYEYKLQQGISAGQKWVYTNSSTYSPQKTSFDNMVSSLKWGANCAMPSNWAYIDMGIMEEGMRFWGASGGGFQHYSDVAPYIQQACTVTQMNPVRTMKEIVAAGEAKPGDVMLCSGHTFIFLGDDPKDGVDKNIYFCAGRGDAKTHVDATADSEYSPSTSVFDSFINYDKNQGSKVYWKISFKESYIPKQYRNSKGEIVKL